MNELRPFQIQFSCMKNTTYKCKRLLYSQLSTGMGKRKLKFSRGKRYECAFKVYIPLDVVQVYPVSIPVSYARVPNRQALSRRLQDVESLPEGWTVANSSSCTTLYKVICNSEPPLVTTDSLVVHDDLTWTLTIASISAYPSRLHSLFQGGDWLLQQR